MFLIRRYLNYFKLEIAELIIIIIVYYFILRHENIVTNLVFLATVLPLITIEFLRKLTFFTGIKIRGNLIGRGRHYFKKEIEYIINELQKARESISNAINKINNNEIIDSIIALETDAWPILTYMLKYDFIGDIEPDLYSSIIELFDRINTINQRLYFLNHMILDKDIYHNMYLAPKTILRLLYDTREQIDQTYKNAIEILKRI